MCGTWGGRTGGSWLLSSFLPVPMGTWSSGVKVHWKQVLLSVVWIVAITTMCLGSQVAHKPLGGETPPHPHLICKVTLELQQQQQDQERSCCDLTVVASTCFPTR